MKRKHALIFIAAIVYLLQLIFKRNNFYLPPLLNNYLADFLCLPLLLSIALFMLHKIKRDATIFLSRKMILFTCFYISFVFEYLLPQYSQRYTSDPFDIIAYFMGGLIYYILQNRRVSTA